MKPKADTHTCTDLWLAGQNGWKLSLKVFTPVRQPALCIHMSVSHLCLLTLPGEIPRPPKGVASDNNWRMCSSVLYRTTRFWFSSETVMALSPQGFWFSFLKEGGVLKDLYVNLCHNELELQSGRERCLWWAMAWRFLQFFLYFYSSKRVFFTILHLW